MKKNAEKKKKQQKEGKMQTPVFDFHLVENTFAKLATWQNCLSATVGLEVCIRSGL